MHVHVFWVAGGREGGREERGEEGKGGVGQERRGGEESRGWGGGDQPNYTWLIQSNRSGPK